jgi:hypothetical protein
VEIPGAGYLIKICVRCSMEFEKSEVDVVDVSPATELADIFLISALKISIIFALNAGKNSVVNSGDNILN